ncbi:MAG: hypothetical protein WD981_02420 [Gaiellaceae bacterium]
MLRLASVCGLALLAASALAVSSSSAPASPAASRIVDRTLLCEVGLQGGVYVATVQAASANRAQKKVALVDLTTKVQPTGRLALISERSIELSPPPGCQRSTGRVALTSRGLSGAVASPFGDEFDCWTPRRVVIRVRAVFTSPVTLRLGRPWGFPLLFARGNVTEASVAVRTQSGKRLAFATVSDTGRARVFTARRDCFAD